MDSSQPVTPPQPEAIVPEAIERFPEPDDTLSDALAELPEQIERLAELDPAAAAEPGAAIADLLSRALEEEER